MWATPAAMATKVFPDPPSRWPRSFEPRHCTRLRPMRRHTWDPPTEKVLARRLRGSYVGGGSSSTTGGSGSLGGGSACAIAVNRTLSSSAAGATATASWLPSVLPSRQLEAATPTESVWAVGGAKRPSPSCTSNRTSTPGTGFPRASMTRTRRGIETYWPTVADCPSPVIGTISRGGPGTATASKCATTESTPCSEAATTMGATRPGSCRVALAVPVESVTATSGLSMPPPCTIRKTTPVSASGAPSGPKARTTNGEASTSPTWPRWSVPSKTSSDAMGSGSAGRGEADWPERLPASGVILTTSGSVRAQGGPSGRNESHAMVPPISRRGSPSRTSPLLRLLASAKDSSGICQASAGWISPAMAPHSLGLRSQPASAPDSSSGSRSSRKGLLGSEISILSSRSRSSSAEAQRPSGSLWRAFARTSASSVDTPGRIAVSAGNCSFFCLKMMV